MAPGPASAAEVVQTTGNRHNDIGETFGSVTELVFSNATDFHARHGVLHADPRARQVAIVPLLARRQFRALGLFFGCRWTRTLG
jgi:hypothetical protein